MEKRLTIEQETCIWEALICAKIEKRQNLRRDYFYNSSALIENITRLRHLIELTRPSQIGSISVFRKTETMKSK